MAFLAQNDEMTVPGTTRKKTGHDDRTVTVQERKHYCIKRFKNKFISNFFHKNTSFSQKLQVIFTMLNLSSLI